MYDPPDYPYQGLSESLQDFNTDESIFNTEGVTFTTINTSGAASLRNDDHLITKQTTMDSYLSLEDNNLPVLDSTVINTDLLVVNDTLSFEPMLLDEQTVNQFLLPLQARDGDRTNEINDEPELLALQSCVICHEIFTSDADLLDHTISVHVSDNTLEDTQNVVQPAVTVALADDVNLIDTSTVSFGLGEEWFVCSVCQRVLSTALEVEPTEQLCCSNISGKSSVTRKTLESMYVCDYCSGLFGDGESLDKHKTNCSAGNETSFYVDDAVNEITVPESTTYTSGEFFDCEVCGKQCASDEELKIHTATCHVDPTYMLPKRRSYVRNSSSKMWNCGSCNQLFSTARELYRHKRGEDRPEGAPLTAYVCEECDKVLGSMCALHTHRKMHKNIKPGYPCQICGRRFNQSGHLAIHMRMHTGERPYPCDLCPKAFKVKVERDDHRRTHTGERPFACTACPKTFTAAARLREHARIHTDQRPYKCEICGAAFRRPYARTVHTLIHTGEKPHECDICGTAFRRSGDMWKHKRTIHGTQLPGA